ncbi:TPA: hypothetical protein QB234_001465 [Pasteurella multocida]|nr:hypothetical protein [Pasteurella multocida]HDR1504932.1 hypothetical protein [Pasteurella multocida]HDR1585791.1 hypothetical protein [Pasteurella multocida]HDR1912823.1 hypothetical protein [Pasteurella multocida]
MKTFFNDVIGMIGIGVLCAGVYQHFGTATTQIVVGSLLLLYALMAARGIK